MTITSTINQMSLKDSYFNIPVMLDRLNNRIKNNNPEKSKILVKIYNEYGDFCTQIESHIRKLNIISTASSMMFKPTFNLEKIAGELIAYGIYSYGIASAQRGTEVVNIFRNFLLILEPHADSCLETQQIYLIFLYWTNIGEKLQLHINNKNCSEARNFGRKFIQPNMLLGSVVYDLAREDDKIHSNVVLKKTKLNIS